MKIIVLADTHVSDIDQLPAKIIEALAGADLIVHAGDFTQKGMLDGLRAFGEVRAVAGDMDSLSVKMALPDKLVFEVGGRKIGVVHGWGGPSGLPGRVRTLFGDCAIVVYEHSHQPHNEFAQGVLMFNPGQARDSFGLITLDNEIRGEIVRI